MREYIDTPADYSSGFIMKNKSPGPILWEQKRSEKDKYFVETNLYFAMLESHTNLSLIASID